VRGKDCDAYPTLTKHSWGQFKKYGKFAPAAVADDSFIMDKSSFSAATAARLAQLRFVCWLVLKFGSFPSVVIINGGYTL
jgi:hypothetical protein